MTTDIQLLELAAKAAGLPFNGYASMFGSDDRGAYSKSGLALEDGRIWNPLDHDGDALRLATKLRIISLWFRSDNGKAVTNLPTNYENRAFEADNARRAIVRAAAEIGRAMP